MSYGYDSLEDVLGCLKRMESIVLGLKQLRNFVSQGRVWKSLMQSSRK